MDLRSFQRRLLHAIRADALLSPRATVVLAVSGGADSMALLDALNVLARRGDTGWRLHIAHLNHGIRGRPAAGDYRFVYGQAISRGLEFHGGHADVPTLAKSKGMSIEESARDCRYAFLHETARALQASRVALGHHADDQIETILHHLIRGTGLRGLSGMPVSRPITPQS